MHRYLLAFSRCFLLLRWLKLRFEKEKGRYHRWLCLLGHLGSLMSVEFVCWLEFGCWLSEGRKKKRRAFECSPVEKGSFEGLQR